MLVHSLIEIKLTFSDFAFSAVCESKQVSEPE